MLAKQRWRMLANPNSLVVTKLLKAKYYPRDNTPYDAELRVKDLWLQDVKKWNMRLLHLIVSPEDVQAILSILRCLIKCSKIMFSDGEISHWHLMVTFLLAI